MNRLGRNTSCAFSTWVMHKTLTFILDIQHLQTIHLWDEKAITEKSFSHCLPRAERFITATYSFMYQNTTCTSSETSLTAKYLEL